MNMTPEYCFLGLEWWPTCMQKSEWAAWVQAGGALLALWVAIRLARAAIDERRAAAKVGALLFAHRLNQAVSAMYEACQRQLSPDHFERRSAVLFEVASFGSAVNMTDLDSFRVNSFLALRALAAECQWASKHVLLHHVDFEHWMAEFAALSERASLLLIEIGGDKA